MTPQAPVQERPPVEPTALLPAPPSGPPTPQWLWSLPPNSVPPYPVSSPLVHAAAASAPQPPLPSAVPTPGQRLGLAIASLALFIPLVALSGGIVAPLAGAISAWLSVTAALIGVLLVSFVVVTVNVVFNWDALRPRR